MLEVTTSVEAKTVAWSRLNDAINHTNEGWAVADPQLANEVIDVLVALAIDLLFNGRQRGRAAAERYIAGLLDD